MITILPLKDKAVLDEFNQKHKQNAGLAFCLYDGKSLDGYILYNISEKIGEILFIQSNDESYVDGLVRAVLASMYDFGINQATFANTLDINLLKKLDLLNNDELIISSIKELIFNCANCKSKGNCTKY